MTTPTLRTLDANPFLEAAGQLVLDALDGHPDYLAGTKLALRQLLVTLDGGRVHVAIRSTPDATPIPVAVVIVNPTDLTACPVVTIDAVGLARSIIDPAQQGHD